MVTGKTRQVVPGLLSAAVLFLNNEPLSAFMRWGQTQLFLPVTSLPTFHKSLCHPRTPLLWSCESNHMCENGSNASSSLDRRVQNSVLKIKRGGNFHTRALMGGCVGRKPSKQFAYAVWGGFEVKYLLVSSREEISGISPELGLLKTKKVAEFLRL